MIRAASSVPGTACGAFRTTLRLFAVRAFQWPGGRRAGPSTATRHTCPTWARATRSHAVAWAASSAASRSFLAPSGTSSIRRAAGVPGRAEYLKAKTVS